MERRRFLQTARVRAKMGFETHFDLYGAVGLRLNLENASRIQRLAGNLDMLLDFFQVDTLERTNLTINLGQFTPLATEETGSKTFDSTTNTRYRIGNGYLYSEARWKTAVWRVEFIDLDEDHIIINLDSNLAGHLFYPAHVVEPAIRMMLFDAGHVLIHAAGVADGLGALVISGPGGSGKTSCALHLIWRGYGLLGDDFVSLKGNTIFPFPKFLHVLDYHLRNLPALNESITTPEKLLLKMKWLLHRSSFGYAKLFSHFRPTDIRQLAISEPAELRQLVLLDTKDTNSAWQQVEATEAARALASDTFEEMHGMLPELEALASAFPGSRPYRYLHGIESSLAKSLSEVECFKIGSQEFLRLVKTDDLEGSRFGLPQRSRKVS